MVQRRLTEKVWDDSVVREWSDVMHDARRKGGITHLGRLFGICVEKGSELAVGDPRRKYKYRVVFQGNNVVDQNWEVALFQDLGSCPATMEAGKAVDAHGCFPGHIVQQSVAEQAYVQADLKGSETWVLLPDDAWPPGRKEKGYKRPVVRLIKALYGHPDSGTYWEQHCDSSSTRGVRTYEPMAVLLLPF